MGTVRGTDFGDEFEKDGAVDGDVAADAEADKGSEDEKGVVLVCEAETQAKDGRLQTRQVKGPTATFCTRQC